MYIQRVAFVYLFLARANLAIHVKTEIKSPVTNLYDISNKPPCTYMVLLVQKLYP